MDLKEIMDGYLTSDDPNGKGELAEKFVESLRGYEIIIYGAGAVGTSVLSALRMNGMEPLFFVDRRYKEGPCIDGIRVEPPEKLALVPYEGAIIIMAINAEVIRVFDREPLENIKKYNPYIKVMREGVNVANILRSAHCYQKLYENRVFDLAECLDCGGETRLCSIYQKYLYRIAGVPASRVGSRSQKFDWFGYIMGQYCSLKCKDCCEHVPYFKNPVFSKYDTILSDCSKIAASCEFIRYIELVGGEPFLHPDLERILKGLLQIRNVGYIKIFTNGTIVPKDEVLKILTSDRIVVDLSNYTSQTTGRLLENIHKTMDKFKEYNIRYIYSESKEWTDWGDFHDRGRTRNLPIIFLIASAQIVIGYFRGYYIGARINMQESKEG